MRLTHFKNPLAFEKEERETDWPRVVAAILNPRLYDSKADMPLLKLTTFGETRTEKNSLRSDKNVTSISGVELDYDGETVSLAEARQRLEAAGIRCVLFTTASHEPDAPRWRALVPFDVPVTGTEHELREARRAAAEKCNTALGGGLSNETFSLSQAFYYGRVKDVPYEAFEVAGADVRSLPLARTPWRGDSRGDGQPYNADDVFVGLIEAGEEIHPSVTTLLWRGWTEEAVRDLLIASAPNWKRAGAEARLQRELKDLPRTVRSALEKRQTAAAKEAEALRRLVENFEPPPYDPSFERIIVKAAEKPIGLPLFALSTLAGEPIPEQKWIIRDMIPAGEPVLFSGDGGLGKSQLLLQLGVAVSTGEPWIGNPVQQRGPVIYLSCEDDKDHLHMRAVNLGDLRRLTDFHAAPMTELDAMLMEYQGREFNVTPLYHELASQIERLKPALVVLDSAANVYGGDEVIRAEVQSFVGHLRKLCHRFGCSIVILSHPSKSGMADGSGSSGSTHWSNAVRARLYLRRPEVEKDEYVDSDARELEVMKNNYGPTGKIINLEYRGGLFVNVDGPGVGLPPPPLPDGSTPPQPPKETAEQRADAVFLELLTKSAQQGVRISHARAVTTFAESEGARAARVSKKQLKAALARLMDTGKVRVQDWKNNGRVSSILTVVEDPTTPHT